MPVEIDRTARQDRFAAEDFVADTQFRLHQLLKAKGVSRDELAAMLGVRTARVSAMFGGGGTMSLHMLGLILSKLGERGVLSSPTIDRRLVELETAEFDGASLLDSLPPDMPAAAAMTMAFIAGQSATEE